jgi:hypothetical protein
MALRDDQRRQLVHRHRDPLLAYAAPNADPVHGRLDVPSARDLLSQHSLTWDEWSSPGELIHPGDLASIASIASTEGDLDLLLRSWRLGKKHPETGAGAIHSIGTMAA